MPEIIGERRQAISTFWIVSNIALWILVLVETGLLLRLLTLLGNLREQGVLLPAQRQSIPSFGGLEVGTHAPPFSAIDTNGNTVELQTFQKQRCILAFISPDCSACAGVVEAIQTIGSEEHCLTLLLIGDTNSEFNRVYAVEHGIQLPVLTPASGLAKNVYRIPGVPFVFMLDEAGVIRAKGVVNQREQLEDLLVRAFPTLPVFP
jgi:methylamine dehydrogenase accessory protein MauD